MDVAFTLGLGAGLLIAAAVLVGICLVMSWFIAPETKGKSLAETSALEGIDSVYKAR